MSKSMYNFKELDNRWADPKTENDVWWWGSHSGVAAYYKGYCAELTGEGLLGNCGILVLGELDVVYSMSAEVKVGLLHGLKRAIHSLKDEGFGKVVMSDSSATAKGALRITDIAEFLDAQQGTTVPNPSHQGKTMITMWEYDL